MAIVTTDFEVTHMEAAGSARLSITFRHGRHERMKIWKNPAASRAKGENICRAKFGRIISERKVLRFLMRDASRSGFVGLPFSIVETERLRGRPARGRATGDAAEAVISAEEMWLLRFTSRVGRVGSECSGGHHRRGD